MEKGSEDLRSLVEQSGSGNTESFKMLYEHLVGRLFAYARSRVGNKEQSVDLIQEVFIDLWRALPRFTYQSSEQFYAFVFVIMRRKLAKRYAAKKKEAVRLDDTLPVADPAQAGKEDKLDIIEALDILDDDTREILMLHHWSRYTFGEIAKLVGMNETAVRVRHHRALKLLRDHLEQTS